MNSKEKLTSHSRGSGCGCKIAPADLESILSQSGTAKHFDNLLIGNESRDDAAVVDWGDGTALISTTDFFQPIVDDPFDFGYIAAVNAISDVYAMGGKPLVAIAILGWPVEKLGHEMAAKVIEGGRTACEDAGIALGGGHSIDALEPFFGLAVNGRIDSANIKTNSGAQVGDRLFLSKPIGTGIVTAASKRGIAKPEHVEFVTALMKQSNAVGAELGQMKSVHAITDVTGFGVMGHLIEMCEGSKVSANIQFENVPVLPDNMLDEYLAQFVMPDNTMRNFKAIDGRCSQLSARQLQVLCDPQTSGGLLVSSTEDLTKDFPQFTEVGVITEQGDKLVEVS
jgi:selenide,water dikinase